MIPTLKIALKGLLRSMNMNARTWQLWKPTTGRDSLYESIRGITFPQDACQELTGTGIITIKKTMVQEPSAAMILLFANMVKKIMIRL